MRCNKNSKTSLKFCAKIAFSIFIFVSILFSGCSKKVATYKINKTLDTSKNVRLVVAYSIKDFQAIEISALEFNKLYPNCVVDYEYMQDFGNTLPKRLESETNTVDLVFWGNIQRYANLYGKTIDYLDYSDKVDLSGTLPGLVDNFKIFITSDELRNCPIGGEMRGMFVNKSFLKKFNLDVPKTKGEFIEACRIIRNAGYIPIQGNPGRVGQQLIYPLITYMINYTGRQDEIHEKINKADSSLVDFLEPPLHFLYDLVKADYYNYKYIQEEFGTFLSYDDDITAKDFLGIRQQGNGYIKTDDVGNVAFMVSHNTLKLYLDRNKEIYHSNIDYEFILSPTGDEGGYAYMSPSVGLTISNKTQNLDWCLEFANFLFSEKYNTEFCENTGFVPNTAHAREYVSEKFSVPVETVGDPGQMTFDWPFYPLLTKVIEQIVKCNNPKYFGPDGKMREFSYFMELFKENMENQREKLEKEQF